MRLAWILAVLLAAAPARLPERDAVVLVPDGMPAAIDRALYFQDGALFSLLIRNRSREAARVRLRVFAFDDRSRLRGAQGYCGSEILQPGTAQRLTFPIEIKGTTARDRFVLVLEALMGERTGWHLEGSPDVAPGAAAGAARSAVDLQGPRVEAIESPAPGGIPDCDCRCDRVAAAGERLCGAGALTAFTCTPAIPGGCRESATCRPMQRIAAFSGLPLSAE